LDSAFGSSRCGAASGIFSARKGNARGIGVCAREIVAGLGGTERGFGSLSSFADAEFFLAPGLFDVEGTLLTFGFDGLTEAVHAGAAALFASLEALAKHGKEVGAAGREHANADVADAPVIFFTHLGLYALAQ
jgi:hypothetical protein